MKNKVHIWEIPVEIVVHEISTDFSKLILSKVKSRFRNHKHFYDVIAMKTRYSSGVIKNYFDKCIKHGKGKINVPLKILIEICEMLNISKGVLERNIKAYSLKHSTQVIRNPKLPIVVSPVFDMLVIHFGSDGYEQGEYGGFEELQRKRFMEKVKFVLGDINMHEDSESVFVSKILVEILKVPYPSLTSFKTFEFRVPNEIKLKDKNYLVACLAAAIIDEGTFTDYINIISANNLYLKDLHDICLKLGYSVSKIKLSKRAYYFIIYSITKFYNDLRKLIKLYPFADLAQKQKSLELAVKIRRKEENVIVGLTKAKIIEAIKMNPGITTKEIQEKVMVTRTTLNHHLRFFLNNNILKNVREGAFSRWYLAKQEYRYPIPLLDKLILLKNLSSFSYRDARKIGIDDLTPLIRKEFIKKLGNNKYVLSPEVKELLGNFMTKVLKIK